MNKTKRPNEAATTVLEVLSVSVSTRGVCEEYVSAREFLEQMKFGSIESVETRVKASSPPFLLLLELTHARSQLPFRLLAVYDDFCRELDTGYVILLDQDSGCASLRGDRVSDWELACQPASPEKIARLESIGTTLSGNEPIPRGLLKDERPPITLTLTPAPPKPPKSAPPPPVPKKERSTLKVKKVAKAELEKDPLPPIDEALLAKALENPQTRHRKGIIIQRTFGSLRLAIQQLKETPLEDLIAHYKSELPLCKDNTYFIEQALKDLAYVRLELLRAYEYAVKMKSEEKSKNNLH